MKSIRAHEKWAAKELARAGVDSPGLCARVLAAAATGLDEIGLILAAENSFTVAQERNFLEMIARRRRGEPLAYILGFREFFSLSFHVSPDTLIPRPESELIVESALALAPEQEIRFADLCCGSGCIGLALMANRRAWKGILLDNSPGALRVAARNMKMLALDGALTQADIFRAPLKEESLELVVANPPYVAFQEKDDIMREVLEYEPLEALFSDNDGLAHIEAVIRQAWRALRPGGLILLEHGAAQGEAVLAMLRQYGFKESTCLADLAGRPRCATGRK